MSDNFEIVFARLRAVMLDAAPGMTVTKDGPGALELRTPTIDAKTKQPGWYGTVTIKKSYVAYHLMPIYERPALASDISANLTKRRQGKTCFNFTRIDEPLFDELSLLSKCCATAIDS